MAGVFLSSANITLIIPLAANPAVDFNFDDLVHLRRSPIQFGGRFGGFTTDMSSAARNSRDLTDGPHMYIINILVQQNKYLTIVLTFTDIIIL